jgi:hypothetical protein
MNVAAKAPVWFIVIAVVALLWNLLGCLAMAADFAVVASGRIPADQQALYAARPAWAVIGSCLAVLAGALGSLALVLRRRWAVPVLILSLLGVLIQDAGFFVMSRSVALPVVAVAMQTAVLLIAIGLVLLARMAAARGWLR